MAREQYFLDWPVDDWTENEIKRRITNSSALDIFISSVGGSVNSGFAIANYIIAANAAGKDIQTHILSNADSIASVIFLAPPKEKRSIVESSTAFIHEPRFMMAFDIDQKKAKQIDEELEIQKNRIADYYVKQIEGLDKSEALALMAGERNLTASEMLDLGIVNEVKDKLDIAAMRGININNKNKRMGLFGSNKKALNLVNSGDKTFAYEGELAVGSELTQVGIAEAKLEGEHVIADGRKLIVDKDNKVKSVFPPKKKEGEEEEEGAKNQTEAIVNSVSEMLAEFENKVTALIDEKIENIRRTGSSHKPPKADGSQASGDIPKSVAQSTIDIKAQMRERIENLRNA